MDKLPDGLHQTVGGSDFPVQVADIRLDTTFFHLPDSSPLMDSGDYINPLSGIGAQVKPFRAVIGFQIAVGRVRPSLPPDFGVLPVVPVYCVLLMAFPSAGRKPDALPVLVKVVHFTALGEPFAFFVHRPHGEQDMGVWVAVPLVMDGKVGNHAFGNKKLPAVVTDKVGVLSRRDFPWDGKHESPGKLGVPLFFLRFG